MIFFIFTFFIFSLDIDAGRMILKDKGRNIILKRGVILQTDDVYAEFDKGVWNKERNLVFGEGNIFFIVKSSTSILKGEAKEAFYDEKKGRFFLKGTRNIVYNYFVKDTTYTFHIIGDSLSYSEELKKVNLKGEVVGVNFEDYLIRGNALFYNDFNKVLSVECLKKLEKKNDGMEVSGKKLIYRIEDDIIFIDGNVKGKIILK